MPLALEHRRAGRRAHRAVRERVVDRQAVLLQAGQAGEVRVGPAAREVLDRSVPVRDEHDHVLAPQGRPGGARPRRPEVRRGEQRAAPSAADSSNFLRVSFVVPLPSSSVWIVASIAEPAPHGRLVLDWDGTVTEVDGLHMVLLEFGDVRIYEASEEGLGRKLTLREVIDREFETVTAPLDEVVAWLVENVRVRAGLRRARRALSPARRLERLPRADRADPGAGGGRGGVAREPARTAAGRLARAVARRDRVRCLRRARASGRRSRRAARSSTSATATPTAASRWQPTGSSRATAWPTYLDEQGVPYERFETLVDVVQALSS